MNTVKRYSATLDAILERGQSCGVSYRIETRTCAGAMVDRQCHVLTARSATIEAPTVIDLSQSSDQIDCKQEYLLQAPFKIVEIVPILKDCDKLEVYDAMGFFVLPPSPLTFKISNSQSCSVVVCHAECVIFGSRVKHADIDPRKLVAISQRRSKESNRMPDTQQAADRAMRIANPNNMKFWTAPETDVERLEREKWMQSLDDTQQELRAPFPTGAELRRLQQAGKDAELRRAMQKVTPPKNWFI